MKTIAYPLAVGGLMTRVIEAGQGPVILFIHGLGARADRWAGMVSLMGQAGFRAIACDLPGHGFASKGDECPADVPGLADFITALLDRLEIDRAFLVGTSLGAHIAAYVACGNPARFPKLALVGALGIVPLAQETAETIRRNVKAAEREQITAKLRYVLYDPSLVTDELIEEEWRMNNSPGALTSFTKIGDYLVDGISRDYVAEELRAAYTPAQLLLVWGENDGSVPLAVGTACQAALGEPELVVIPQSGHAPYFEQPEIFKTALTKFLKT
jgi:2-hydroxy-6-oxonona-2,4-dienedioate hydrolase